KGKNGGKRAMSKGWKIILVVIFICQILVISFSFINYELVMKDGTEIKLRVEGYDPLSPLMGRYIDIRAKDNKIKKYESEKYIYGYNKENEYSYVILGTDEKGFAVPIKISESKPTEGIYIKVENLYAYGYYYEDEQGKRKEDKRYKEINFSYPFTRFYLNEYDAITADEVIPKKLQLGENSNDEIYMTVKVKDGRAVISNLWVEGLTIDKYLEKYRREQKK
ncbi:MAG: GDYXXLXY domain-containing protein, partial [Lentisphaeria bacterium]